MSIHFLSRTRIETEDSVTAGFSCGLALATSLPEALYYSSLGCIVSVTYSSIPLRIRTQDAVRSRNRDSIRTSILYRSSWRQTFMSKTGPILVFLCIHPFAQVFFSHRGSVYSRNKCCILSPFSVSKCEEVLSFFDNSQISIRA